METIKNNPVTTFVAVVTAITNVWNLAVDNAALLGIGGKTIAIGSLVLTAAMVVYNTLKPASK